jgi:hypothetical protein
MALLLNTNLRAPRQIKPVQEFMTQQALQRLIRGALLSHKYHAMQPATLRLIMLSPLPEATLSSNAPLN